jgi:hypothetical protein
MSKAVAVEGDTKVETSTAKHPADINKTGSWSLMSSSVIAGTKVSFNGKKVEISAIATWSYVGGTVPAPPAPPTPLAPIPDSASLSASSTKLTDAGKGILVDGDEEKGKVDSGNKITVSASQSALKTD